MTLTTLPFDDLLDLSPWVGQRSATFRFDLVNGVTGAQLGTLTPERDTPAVLTHDTGRTITRQIANFSLGAVDTAAVNVITDRVLVSMRIAEQIYPMGRYMFIDQTRARSTSGLLSNAALVDEMFIVDQPITQGFSAKTVGSPNGVGVTFALGQIMTGLPVQFLAQASPFNTVGSWAVGTSRGQMVENIALDGDYFSPWLDNAGVMRFTRAFDPNTQIPQFDYDRGRQVKRAGILETDDLLTAPNQFVVISNGTSTSAMAGDPIVGFYNIPATAPHSAANRGFVVPQVVNRQIATQAQATAVAANLGQRQTVFERVELTTPPDPRHDSYDVIRWQGDNWLEIAWSLPLQEGSDMRHVLRKAYSS